MLALLALVTLAASGGSPFGAETADREPSAGAYDYLFTFALVLAGVVVAVTLYLIRPSGRFRHDRTGGHGLGWSLVALAIAVAFAIAVLLAARGQGEEQPEQAAGPRGERAPGQPVRREEKPAPGRDLEFRWPAALALGGAALAVAAGGMLLARRSRRPAVDADEEQLAAALAALLDDTLDDLWAEPDPRRAVVAAYARMERAFAAYGIPRRPFEAPHEYLHRLSRALGDAVTAADRLAFELTHLYERAKFSAQRIDTAMKTDAIAALEALRAELRREDEEAAA